MQAGKRAMKELDLVDGVLDGLESEVDGLEGTCFSDTKYHLPRDHLIIFMDGCNYDITKMTDSKNRSLFPYVYDHLKECPRCYEKVMEVCVVINDVNLYNEIDEARRN